MQTHTQQTLPLSTLSTGQSGTVHSVRAGGLLGSRLRDMGLMPGVHFEVTGHAPLGDPMSVSLAGYGLSLRASEASEILVCPCPAQAKEGNI